MKAKPVNEMSETDFSVVARRWTKCVVILF